MGAPIVCVCVLLVQGMGDADAGLDTEHLRRKALKRKKKKKKTTVYDVSDCQVICGNVWQTVADCGSFSSVACLFLFCCMSVLASAALLWECMPRPTH